MCPHLHECCKEASNLFSQTKIPDFLPDFPRMIFLFIKMSFRMECLSGSLYYGCAEKSLFPNWNLLPICSLHKEFKKIPPLLLEFESPKPFRVIGLRSNHYTKSASETEVPVSKICPGGGGDDSRNLRRVVVPSLFWLVLTGVGGPAPPDPLL